MGLDMYLDMDLYVYLKSPKVMSMPGTDGFVSLVSKNYKVSVEVGYWRKFNALHAWFVNSFQGGVDECRSVSVGEKDIRELLDTVITPISKDHSLAEELLPTQSGFFFGGTDYDEWYFEQIEETRTILSRALRDAQEARRSGVEVSFTYIPSW